MQKTKIYEILIAGLIITTLFLNVALINCKDPQAFKGLVPKIEIFAKPDLEVTHEDKVTLAEYSYSVLDNYFNESRTVMDISSVDVGDFDYEKIFITYIHKGKLRCSQSGSNQDEKNRIFNDLLEANLECIEDDRFGGILSLEEYLDTEIVFNFLFNKQKLGLNDLDYLEGNLELGIHAIEIRNGNERAFFKESVPISKNYDTEYTLERLCKKAGFENTCYRYWDTEIYKYDTLTFKVDREYDVIDLYRYNQYVELQGISNDTVMESIQLGGQWFLNNLNEYTGLLEYMYLPSVDEYSSDNNHVRQIASLWAMSELKHFLHTDAYDRVLHDSIDHYLAFKTEDNYLMIEEEAKLAYNAFLIMALIGTDYPDKEALLSGLSEAILSQQNADGSYDTYFASDRDTGIDFYPGEAMLALMKMYTFSGDERYLDSVRKAFPFYRDYWRDNVNTAFIPWHSQVYLLLYEDVEDPELAEFVFEMNDWLIDEHQISESEYKDTVGGFTKEYPRYSTSSYMESINDAYQLAVLVDDDIHQEKYAESIKNGVRFVLQTQYHDQNTFYLENPKSAIGGFTKSHVSNEQRNDYTQHAVLALIKTYKNSIFE